MNQSLKPKPLCLVTKNNDDFSIKIIVSLVHEHRAEKGKAGKFNVPLQREPVASVGKRTLVCLRMKKKVCKRLCDAERKLSDEIFTIERNTRKFSFQNPLQARAQWGAQPRELDSYSQFRRTDSMGECVKKKKTAFSFAEAEVVGSF